MATVNSSIFHQISASLAEFLLCRAAELPGAVRPGGDLCPGPGQSPGLGGRGEEGEGGAGPAHVSPGDDGEV